MSLYLLLMFLTLASHTQVSSALKDLMKQWETYRNECIQNFRNSPPPAGVVCNRTFDNYACWPDGSAGSVVNVSCPWYLPWHRKVRYGQVYRVCGADGRWSDSKNTTECDANNPGMKEYGQILSRFRVMYTVGYSLSLASLILAFSILAAFRKLHCMRNNIHMNLFASFILRAASILIKDALMDTINSAQSGLYTYPELGQNWVNLEMVTGCRVAVVMMQYSVIANNYWLLVEGLYLHSLLSITVFSERNYFYIYLAIGWGAPVIFVLPWVTVKYLYENEMCWERNVNMGYWWIIRSPILIAYLINFFIFIRILKILMSKLKAHQMRYTDYKFRIERLPVGGGRGRIFNAEQEAAVVNMVLANNAIRLREIKAAVIADQGVFRNIHTVSEATIDRVLRRNHMAMKQLYRVPFQRNSEAVKEARCQYVERIMELEAEGAHHIFIYVDEAGFNLCKVRRRGRNLIGNRATITVPGQRGANITMCAAISNDGVLCHIPTIGPYNTERLIAFLNALYDILIPPQERGLLRPGMPRFVIIWDNVAFHHSRIVNEWFAVHCRMMVQFLPPYSPFLNPIEEFFSAWRWKVYNHRPYEQMPLLNAMTAAAQDIDAEACQGWIRHARRFFPRCIARENIECDVDEALWPRLQERGD